MTMKTREPIEALKGADFTRKYFDQFEKRDPLEPSKREYQHDTIQSTTFEFRPGQKITGGFSFKGFDLFLTHNAGSVNKEGSAVLSMSNTGAAFRILKETLQESLDEDMRLFKDCLLYTSPSPRDLSTSRMPSSA